MKSTEKERLIRSDILSIESRVRHAFNQGYDLGYKDGLQKNIKALQSVKSNPKTGHWIYSDECHEHGRCSECGYGIVDLVNGEPHNFCRRCGARMVDLQESEDEE